MSMKSARLTCPDCGCEPTLERGQRICPQCDAQLVIDSDTFDHAPTWTYTQKRDAPRGGVQWTR